jgi:hypothetical protein
MAHHKSSGSKVAGMGLAALAAAAAGAYFLYGTDAGKKRRQQIKSWSLKMRADVLDRMEKMREWSEEAYNAAIDTVSEKYKGIKSIDPSELAVLVAELKRHWKHIKQQVEQGQKKTAPRRKAPAKKKSNSK